MVCASTRTRAVGRCYRFMPPAAPTLSIDADASSRWCFDDGDSAPYSLRYTPSRGVHAVARRRLRPGETVLLEPPLVSTRTDVAAGLPSDAPEWALVHALLTLDIHHN